MNIDEVIQKYITKGRRTRMLLLTSLEWMLVAGGVMITSLTLPSIVEDLAGTTGSQNMMASSVFVGMLLGALFSGMISDRFGRKWTNLILLLIAGLSTGFTGASVSMRAFSIGRFVAGIGYGGLLPVVNAYLTEFSSIKIRGLYLALLESSWAIGSIITGGFTMLTLNSLGWRWSFYFLALFSVPLLLISFFLPESPKYQFMKKGKVALEKILGKEIDEEIEMHKQSKQPILGLFKGDLARRTIMIWISWFSVSFVYYGIYTWAPKIFMSKGLTPVSSLWYTFFMLIMQLPGYLTAVILIERIGRKPSLTFFFGGMAVSSIVMALVNSSALLLVASVLISLFVLGAWGMVYAYTPELYPTEMRALGNGASGVMARAAGIVAPFFTNLVMGGTGSVFVVMIFMAALSLFAAIIVSKMGVETKQAIIE
ncbi:MULTISPECIES: MFS transporter [Mesotoga]|jgi:putative MFS transporter|uniref:MFS transporter n=2 Tax=Kosmotogaceae TaxID=1643948 RepID=UPI0002CB58D7|nr:MULTISPECIES: MFS transporter [Mesotoga]MCP5456508.1 MFS transporter [Thermotogota bacterium]CCU85772.1 Major facilitator superfamily MFS_1 [Mesotoga infera]MCP5460469.1 MFS transporter [Thermotogota bacterium]MDK2943371.1 transporter, putative metabolite:H+ symporter [Mesotoga sp.]HNQ70182.1 MFS transporter [Mesotoga prima]